MRAPGYAFVLDQEKQPYEVIYPVTHPFATYRKVSRDRFFRSSTEKTFRGLLLHEAMVRVEHDEYAIAHACVPACHCERCGADVGELCRGAYGPVKHTHYQRRDLWRSVNDGRRKRRRK